MTGHCGSATFRLGPFQFTATNPGKAPSWPGRGPSGSQDLPAEFDEVAGELGRTLDFAKVPKREKAEVPAAFAATKKVAGSALTSDRVKAHSEHLTRPDPQRIALVPHRKIARQAIEPKRTISTLAR